MARVDGVTGTAYLNAATVPRVVRAADGIGATLHHFLTFELRDGAVECASDVWVRVCVDKGGRPEGAGGGEGAAGGCGGGAVTAEVATESEVLRTVRGDAGVVRLVWDAHEQLWHHVVVGAGSGGGEGEAAAVVAAER